MMSPLAVSMIKDYIAHLPGQINIPANLDGSIHGLDFSLQALDAPSKFRRKGNGEVDHDIRIPLQDGGQTAGVIAVIMADNNYVHFFHVDLQEVRVAHQDLGSASCIKQDDFFHSFDETGKSPVGFCPRAVKIIIIKNGESKWLIGGIYAHCFSMALVSPKKSARDKNGQRNSQEFDE